MNRIKAANEICEKIEEMIKDTKDKKYIKQLKAAKTLVKKSVFDFGGN